MREMGRIGGGGGGRGEEEKAEAEKGIAAAEWTSYSAEWKFAPRSLLARAIDARRPLLKDGHGPEFRCGLGNRRGPGIR